MELESLHIRGCLYKSWSTFQGRSWKYFSCLFLDYPPPPPLLLTPPPLLLPLLLLLLLLLLPKVTKYHILWKFTWFTVSVRLHFVFFGFFTKYLTNTQLSLNKQFLSLLIMFVRHEKACWQRQEVGNWSKMCIAFAVIRRYFFFCWNSQCFRWPLNFIFKVQ